MVDRFNQNLVSLQTQIQAIRQTEKQTVQALVDRTQRDLPLQSQTVNNSVKEYEQALREIEEATKL